MRSIILLGTVLIFSSVPVQAAPPDGRPRPWIGRFSLLYVDAAAEDAVAGPGGISVSFETGDGTGLGMAYEKLFGERFGLELGVGLLRADVEGSVALAGGERRGDSGSLQLIPLTLGANFHLSPHGRADLYLGPLVAYVFQGSEEFRLGTFSGDAQESVLRLASNEEAAFGAQVGLDLPLGERGWGLNLAVRYLDLSVDTGTGAELDVAPLTAGVGVARRF